MEKMDFAKGYKTITGSVILLLPLIRNYLGVDISDQEVTAIFDNVMNISGSVLFIYGIIMKAWRQWKEQKQR